jgi:hypothetical protein
MRAVRHAMAILAATYGFVFVGGAAAVSPVDYAKGSGVTSGGTEFHFTVHSDTPAWSLADGKIRIDRAEGTTSAEPVCLGVQSTAAGLRFAEIRADILTTTDPVFATTDAIIVRILDGGPNGAGDSFTFAPFFDADSISCIPVIFGLPNVVKGDIVIFDQ